MDRLGCDCVVAIAVSLQHKEIIREREELKCLHFVEEDAEAAA